MVRSMTGFGRHTCKKENIECTIELKTVNNRYLDTVIRLPKIISYMEKDIKSAIAAKIARGKVDVTVTFEDFSDNGFSVNINKSLANAYIETLRSLIKDYNLKDDIGIDSIVNISDIISVTKNELDEQLVKSIIEETLKNAIDVLLDMREKEGNALKHDLLDKLELIEGYVKKIEQKGPGVVEDYKNKLQQRLKEILQDVVIDETRITTEVAIFADKCSVDEEIVRILSHIKQFRQMLEKDEPVGRKLDFLIQEMNRETNTIGSKANNLEITQIVVEIKGELEKIREQVQNIE